jgi:formylmethanofuran dehydrogenase subunit D
VRWPERVAASELSIEPAALKVPQAARAGGDGLRLGTFRTLWASKEVDVSPALQFARPEQVVELSPADAQRLGIGHGDDVEVGSNGHRLRGAAVVRDAVPQGSVFVAEGIVGEPFGLLTDPVVQVRALAAVGAPVAESVDDIPSGDASKAGARGGDEDGAPRTHDVRQVSEDMHAAQDAPIEPTGGGGDSAPDSGPEKATGGGA